MSNLVEFLDYYLPISAAILLFLFIVHFAFVALIRKTIRKISPEIYLDSGAKNIFRSNYEYKNFNKFIKSKEYLLLNNTHLSRLCRIRQLLHNLSFFAGINFMFIVIILTALSLKSL